MIYIDIVRITYEDYSAEINLNRGGNCVSLKNKKYNADILHSGGDCDNPYVCGMPILFPANRISNGEFDFEGRKYIFPINEPTTICHLHGFLHTARFELVQKTESFVKCRYNSDELYKFFPHEFRIEITHLLSDNGLLQEVCVANLSDTDMPVLLGFHTTFNIPFIPGESGKNIRVLSELDKEIERDGRHLPNGNILAVDEISELLNNGQFVPFGNSISRHYKSGKNGKIEIIDTKNRLKIIYDTDKKFGWRLLYKPVDSNYICIEPQNCMVDCMNTSAKGIYGNYDYISPKTCKKYVSKIYIEEF